MIVDRPDGRGKLLSVKLVAQILGVAYRTLRSWVKKGRFPEPLRLKPRRHFFAEETVRAWIELRRAAP